MDRKDYLVGWEKQPGGISRQVNVAAVHPAERSEMDTSHLVLLGGSTTEIGLLLRGLRALKANMELGEATSGRPADTKAITDLINGIETPHVVERGLPSFDADY